ncbi:cytochrome b/b6 domain-containing protein [Glacieibacterium frigidum]|uniref:DUF4405 domain-containing protein n=1 Tax=Glacieibacterium frigidum TaxID=2593303 RepID=A0A552UF80_9SPHN|nr:cytochrome b/b6 domain-containing protein [Glacieibacterium frigidum]TRW16888.1 DUF4405 domain-containing protein [Glacieibacterium frigidum]
MATMAAPDIPAPPAAPYLFKRHALATRITHWVNALAIAFLIGTGLNIFNAHPALYWGEAGATTDTRGQWLAIGAVQGAGGEPRGMTRVGPVTVDTTGVLGVAGGPGGQPLAQGFPSWSTFPSVRDLATARNWHFFFAWIFILNGLLYIGFGLWSGHLRHDLLPRLRELRVSNIWHDIVTHAKLKFPKGEDAKRYHILQKLSYAGTALVVLPLLVLTGLAMSPSMGATTGWLIELFGGRQSARSIHFICMVLTVGFTLVHILMVMLAGPYNEIRSMITGRFRIDPEKSA